MAVMYTEGSSTYGDPEMSLASTLKYIAFDYQVGTANGWVRYRDSDGNICWNDNNWTDFLEVSKKHYIR